MTQLKESPLKAASKTLLEQVLPSVALLSAGISIYFVTMQVPPGLLTYLISFLSLAIVIVTAFARVNDMNPHLTGIRWHFRRAGLVFAGAGAFAVLANHFPVWGNPVEWNETLLYTGFAMSWLTTPNMPPWWRWISGHLHNAIVCETCKKEAEQ